MERTFSIWIREGGIWVLSLIGRLVRLFKKDFQFLANYERSHPHFFWFLGIDALLSAGIVIGGFTFYTGVSSDAHQLSHVGAAVNTSKEIVKRIVDENLDAYWFGDIPGSEYALNHPALGVVEFYYWRQGTFNVRGKQYLCRVKTFKNETAWNSNVHILLTTANSNRFQTRKKIFITIDKFSMNRVIVRFAKQPEIVTLLYPLPQSLQAIETNVDSLERIK